MIFRPGPLLNAPLQMFQYVRGHLPIDMVGSIPSINAMILVGIHMHVELLVSFYQLPEKLHGVLKMDIVIGAPVDEQKFTLKSVGKMNGGVISISFGILLRGTHKSLGVDGIVIFPVGDR